MSRHLLSLAFLVSTFAATAENVLWIESENTMGVHRSKGSEADSNGDRIIPVPWTSLWSVGANEVSRTTMSNLVSVASLASGSDRIKYFDGDGQVFKVWQWSGRTWGYLEDAHWLSSQAGERLTAEATFLDRGRGLWLRVGNGGDVYLIGQSSTNAPVSVMAAENPYDAQAQLFTESFVANPCDTDVDLLEAPDGAPMLANAVVGDELNVVTSTDSSLYWYQVPVGGTEPTWCTLGKTIQ